MENRRRFIPALVILVVGTMSYLSSASAVERAFAAERASAAEREEYFETRVRPLLVDRCLECHERRAEGGLRLDSRHAMLKGGESGAAIVPGKPAESLLFKVVTGKHDEIKMPPDGDLPQGDIESLRRWIADGSVWPQANSAQNSPAQDSPDSHRVTVGERAFWSFQPADAIDSALCRHGWRRGRFRPNRRFVRRSAACKTRPLTRLGSQDAG